MAETETPDARRAALEAAEARALALFDAIEAAQLVRPGRTEDEVEEDIRALAEKEFGVVQHWHRRIVRSGLNTLATAREFPDALTLQEDDLVYLDLGPVFETWEADIGRTYVLGDDPERRRLAADLPRVFDRVQAHYRANPDITGAELYAFARSAAKAAGWTFGGAIAGHCVGEFPHERWPGERALRAIWPNNDQPLSGLDHDGRAQHWILEIHLVNKARTFAGFYERLM